MKSIPVSVLLFSSIPFTSAAYRPSGSNNVAVYWGQNSVGGAHTQRQLIEVCRDEKDIDIILLSFLISATDMDKGLNFANSDRPTEKEINECQTQHNKTLLLSLGGAATDNTWSFTSQDQAVDAAKRIWSAFGPESSAGESTTRPFGSASVDGFDLDFESPYSNVQVFAQQLRKLMDLEKGKFFYLSAAPQCPYPDMNLNPVLQGSMATALDFVFIQFYNNAPCDLRTADGFRASLDTWDSQWAKSSGAKIFVGIPGARTAISAANSESYVEGSVFASDYLATAQKYASFGGVMVWDMSQLDNNTAFLPPIVSALGGRDDTESASTGTASSNETVAQKPRHRHARGFRLE
ncbi:glycoside hydrolase superfamily [Hypoxylon argillaceum]|nr:glycoside hydrolase superfamily [Hypoxylon argillaceum]